MKRFLYLFLAALFLSAHAGNLRAAEQQTTGSPSILVPEPRYGFQAVTDGEEVSHDFVIRNKGTAPLIIERVKTD